MDTQIIKEIIKAFSEAELTKLALKCEDFELELGKEQTINQTVITEMTPTTRNVTSNPKVMMSDNTLAAEVAPTKEMQMKTITSPMVGTFYASSSPKAKPFVEVGTKVKKGDVVCVIEAMKLMNEVEAEEDGEVVEVLVGNESMVEFGQQLFVMK